MVHEDCDQQHVEGPMSGQAPRLGQQENVEEEESSREQNAEDREEEKETVRVGGEIHGGALVQEEGVPRVDGKEGEEDEEVQEKNN